MITINEGGHHTEDILLAVIRALADASFSCGGEERLAVSLLAWLAAPRLGGAGGREWSTVVGCDGPAGTGLNRGRDGGGGIDV